MQNTPRNADIFRLGVSTTKCKDIGYKSAYYLGLVNIMFYNNIKRLKKKTLFSFPVQWTFLRNVQPKINSFFKEEKCFWMERWSWKSVFEHFRQNSHHLSLSLSLSLSRGFIIFNTLKEFFHRIGEVRNVEKAKKGLSFSLTLSISMSPSLTLSHPLAARAITQRPSLRKDLVYLAICLAVRKTSHAAYCHKSYC